MAVKKYEGIGGATATMLMVLLAAKPTTVFLTVGTWGKVIHWVLTKFFSWLAGEGVAVANVGIARMETMADRATFELAFDEAFEIIEQRKEALSAAEAKKIDDRVRAAFRKFGRFA